MEPELLALKSGDLQGERSTFAFLGILVLACAGIRLVCMALSYLICLYRFLMVWHQIFQLNAQHSSRREEAFPPRHTSTAIRRALLSTQRSEETSCCPICLVDFGTYYYLFSHQASAKDLTYRSVLFLTLSLLSNRRIRTR